MAGYTANKQSLTGGQRQFADGQRQFADGQGLSFGGLGLYFGWEGTVMLRSHKFGQFRVVRNFALQTDGRADQGTHPLKQSHSQRLKTNGTFLSRQIYKGFSPGC